MSARMPLGVLLLFASCPGVQTSPCTVVLLVDSSDSAGVAAERVQKAVRYFLRDMPPALSRLEVFATGCGFGDTALLYAVAVPERWGRGVARRKRAWRFSEDERVKSLTLPAPRTCSPIAEGIFKAASRLKEREGGRRVLWIISDMREVSELGNFEQRLPKPDKFVARLRQVGLLADLSAVDAVSVCSLHDRTTQRAPRWSAKKSVRLRAIWSAAFTEMGAPGVKLAERCPWEDAALGVEASLFTGEAPR